MTPPAARPPGAPPVRVVAIFGPTAVGKTAVAIALAELLRARGEEAVAVSADALQVYAGLERLTAAPSHAERGLLEHRLIGFLPVAESFSAGRYAALAHAAIDSLLAEERRPIVVGGTGLYLRAALAPLDLHRPPQPGARERWSAELRRRGPEALHAELARRAPGRAARIDPHDRQRIVRALELAEQGVLGERARPSQLWTAEMRHPTLLAGLTMERSVLYERIDARVHQIVARGAAAEVRAAERARAGASARKALGYRELLAGDLDAMRRRSRQYARRQLTWMRKLPDVHLIDMTRRSPQAAAAEIALAAGWSTPPDPDATRGRP
jgi:tRNA dimethylallyltransferase